MNKDVANRILDLQDSLKEDPDYRVLVMEHEVLNARFLKTVEELNEEQRAAVFDYVGLLVEIHTQQLARAFEQ